MPPERDMRMWTEYAVTDGEGRLIDYGIVEFNSHEENEVILNAVDNGHTIIMKTADEETVTGK